MPGADLWVLDTHVWIRLLAGDPEFQRTAFLAALEDRSKAGALRLAPISLWETAMLVSKGRLRLDLPVQAWLLKAMTMPGLELVPLGPEIAADSCFLPGDFHGDPADRLIVATTRRVGGTLITCDRAILDYGALGWVAVMDPLSQ